MRQATFDYLTGRGLTFEVLKAARVRDGEAGMANRAVFPWLDPSGEEVYVSGRSINGASPKSKKVGEQPPLFASPGAWQASRVALVEGEIDALACAQAGSSAFATAGSPKEDAFRLLESKDTVILAFDADEQGAKYAEQARRALAGKVELLEVTWPEGCKDAGDVAERAARRGEDPTEALAEVLYQARPAEVESAVRLEVLTTREIAALPHGGDADKLLEDVLVRGHRVVLGAHTGHGKTTFVLHMARAVTLGEEFLGFRGSPGKVLIIDAEQSLRSVQRKLAETGLDQVDGIDYLRVPDGLALDQDEDEVEALRNVLERGYDFVVTDPLYKLHSGDSNDERQAVDLMRLFDAWREEYRFALGLPTHCRKPPAGARFSMHEFFGSSAYLRGAEVVIGLQLIRDGYSRLHFFKDRDGDLPVGSSWGLLYDPEHGFRRDPNDGRKQTAADRIRELLEDDPGMTIEQLIDASGYAERTVKTALKELGATATSGAHNLKAWRLPLEETT